MDGSTTQTYFQQEALSMLDAYKNFEALIPGPNGAGADHKGEDGRFVENLIRSFLSKYLPKELEVLTGFIARPAVKIGKNDKSRRNEKDGHSTQLDIIIIVPIIGAVKHWSIFKARPTKKEPKNAKYIVFKHENNTENHLWLQFLLTGILSVYYDSSRTNITRHGFTSFPSNRKFDDVLGVIVSKIPAKITN